MMLQRIDRLPLVATVLALVVIASETAALEAFDTPASDDAISREFSFAVGSDLVFDQEGTLLPDEGNAEQTFQLTWRVENRGTATAIGPWSDRIQFDRSIRMAGGSYTSVFDINGPTELAPGAFYERTYQFEMPPTAGTFQVRLLLDRSNQVAEAHETNNLIDWHEIEVLAIPRPNLRPLVTGNPLPTPVAGDPVALSFLVWNDGESPTPAPQWQDRVYLVPSPNNGNNPPPDESGAVGSWTFTNLAFLDNDPGGDGSLPGSSYERVGQSLTLPNWVTGKHFLAVRTDAGNAQYEGSESDNLTFSTVFDIQAAPRPDLEVSGVGLVGVVPDTPLGSGTYHTVGWQMLNRGVAPAQAGSISHQVWISSNQNSAGSSALNGDLLLGTFSIYMATLGVGQSVPAQAEIFVPEDIGDLPGNGPYFFKVVIDSNGNVNEEESVGQTPYWNNLAAAAGSYPIFLSSTPDLVPSAIGPAPGQGAIQVAFPLQVDWTVGNGGASGWDIQLTWRDQVWLSPGNQTLGDGDDMLLGTYLESTQLLNSAWSVPASYSKSITVNLPESLVADTYYLIVVTDTTDEVFEFNSGFDAEANNTLVSAAFQVSRDPADLWLAAQAATGSLVPPTGGTPGHALLLPWTVTNLFNSGTTSASSWTDQVHLSSSATALENSVLLISRTHQGALTMADKYDEVYYGTVPFVNAGPWFLHFRTDVYGENLEDNLDNNREVLPFQVTDAVADLVVDMVVAAQKINSGEPVQVNWTVRNGGTAPTGASSWLDRVYLADVPDLSVATEIEYLGAAYRSAALNAGSSYNTTASFFLPQGLTAGEWYVVVQTDSAGQVFELDDANNEGGARTFLDITPPGPGGDGGGGSGTTWSPANLVVRNVMALNDPVTAGQEVQVSWDVANEGTGPTDLNYWEDRVYLSFDGILDASDVFLGSYAHVSFLDVGETRNASGSFIVPLFANGTWKVIVDTDASNGVYQEGATADDVGLTVDLLTVNAPPLTNLAVTSVSLPASVLLGEELNFSWTTMNDSQGDVLAEWNWLDSFWLVPVGGSYPSLQARYLGQLSSNAGLIQAGGGTHVQTSLTTANPLVVPGLVPGQYNLAVVNDSMLQIAELDEEDNVFTSLGLVDLQAIGLVSGGSAGADLANGDSRWFRLSAPADQTIDLMFEHDDPNARCEILLKEGLPPSPGVYDLRSEGFDAVDPFQQSIRIPRTTGADYFVMARAVSGVGATITSNLDALQRDFLVDDVQPPVVGAGVVTVAVSGFELWRAASVELREVGTSVTVATALDVVLLDDSSLLVRFDLSGVVPGELEVVAIDNAQGGTTSTWANLLGIQEAQPFVLRTELILAGSIRRGESGEGVLRLKNIGNVDIPVAMASLGHLGEYEVTDPAQRVLISSAELGLQQIEFDGLRNSLVVMVEDLSPGKTHEVELDLAVGADVTFDFAAIAVAGMPESNAGFENGAFAELSEALRVAVASDPTTPSLVSGVAQSSGAWGALVIGALSSGSLVLDQGTVHSPDDAVRTARDLLQALADAVAIELALPPGVTVPESSVDSVASVLGCYPFVATEFNCDELYPEGCTGGGSTVGVSTQAGGNTPPGIACVSTPSPDDPNVKIKPTGVGPASLVSAENAMVYDVHFENQASATAWASQVLILDTLEPGFRSSTVQFKKIRIGETVIDLNDASGVLELVELQIDPETVVLCQISALVDASTDTIRVRLLALDPDTGQPNSDGNSGLLPPSGPGLERMASGLISFSVMPDDGGHAGDPSTAAPVSAQRRRNTAQIKFNSASTLTTNTTVNILDGRGPTSTLVVESVVDAAMSFSWSADDTEDVNGESFAGSGVRGFSFYVQTSPGGAWIPLLTDSTETSFDYVASQGGNHGFKVEASDYVGNQEAKLVADVIIDVPFDCNNNGIPDDEDIASGTSADCDASGIPDSCEIAAGVHTDINGNGVPDSCECVTVPYCTSAPNSTGNSAKLTPSGIPSIGSGTYELHVIGTPPSRPGLFFYSSGQFQGALGDGVLCLASPRIRLFPVVLTGADGSASYLMDFTTEPLGAGPNRVTPGSTWYFQFWYRDPDLVGGTGFNLSDGLQVTFCE